MTIDSAPVIFTQRSNFPLTLRIILLYYASYLEQNFCLSSLIEASSHACANILLLLEKGCTFGPPFKSVEIVFNFSYEALIFLSLKGLMDPSYIFQHIMHKIQE